MIARKTYLDARVGGVLDGREQRVVLGVKGHGKGAVDYPAVDVDAKVDLHDVVMLQDNLVARVGGVVGGAVVQAEARRETHAALEVVAVLEALVARQGAHAVLDALGNLGQRHARLDVLLRPLPHLAVHLGAGAVLVQKVLVHAVQVALLLARRAEQVFIAVLLNLALGVRVVGEQLRD